MSYPDLGCFAECLTCELCEDDLDEPDFDPFAGIDYDPLDDPDWYTSGPEPYEPDFDFPTGIPVGDFEVSPTFDPLGVEIEGEF